MPTGVSAGTTAMVSFMPVRTVTMSLWRHGVALAVLVTVAAGWLWRQKSHSAGTSETIVPVDADLVLATSVVTMIVVEVVLRLVRRRQIDAADSLNSMTIGLGYFAIGAVFGKLVTFGAYLWVYERFGLFDLSWRAPAVWVAYWVIGDFALYWIHRAEHRVRILWCSHQVHHTSTDFSFTTAVRMPWTSMLYKPLTGLWAPLLGFPPIMYPVMGRSA